MAKNVRSDIPYADRLLYQRFNTLKEHRDDAARTALKLACVALNDTEGLGYWRLVRFAERQQQLTLEYYADPEVQEAHLNERLTQIGFVCRDGRLLGAVDKDGKPVKASELPEEDVLNKAGGIQNRQFFSGWIRTKDKLPQNAGSYIVVIEGAAQPTELFYMNGKWFEETDDDQMIGYRVSHWMPLPEMPARDE